MCFHFVDDIELILYKICFYLYVEGMEYVDSHREDVVDVDVDIKSDDLSATSSDTCMSSNDGEVSQQYWDGCSDNDVMTAFDDIDEINNPPHLDDENNIHRILLMLLCSGLLYICYGISATALNPLVKLLHYVYSILSKNMSTTVTFLTLFPRSLHMMKKYLGF